MNGTLFYVFGITLVVSAVLVALAGLRFEDFPPNRGVLAGVVVYFVALVAGTMTFAVLHAADDQHARQASEAQAATQAPAGGGTASTTTTTTSTSTAPAGKATTVKLAASATAIAYDTKQLSAKSGQVTIDFTNPSAVTHDVCLEDPSGQQVGCSSTISQSNTTLSEKLSSGKYTFFCSVDGHRLAGMEGTLSVK
jgi:plastocyanin